MSVKEWLDGYEIYNASGWSEVSEMQYDAMFERMPLIRQRHSSYMTSEPYTHDNDNKPVYCAFRTTEGKYQAKMMTVKEYDEMTSI